MAETSHNFLAKLESFAKSIGFERIHLTDEMLSLSVSGWTGLHLVIRQSESNNFDFYLTIRTDSWHYADERTDIHDSFSIIFCVYFRIIHGMSFSLFDIPHPAASYFDDAEIYGRYIIPTQETSILVALNEEQRLEKSKDLLLSFWHFEKMLWSLFGGCPCADCKKKLGIKYDYKNTLSKALIAKIESCFGNPTNYNLKDRNLPTWKYYRSFDDGVSVLKSKPIADFLLNGIKSMQHNIEVIGCVNGELLIQGELKNFCSGAAKSELLKVLKNLDGLKKELPVFPLDNKMIMVGKSFIVVKDFDSGESAFKRERDLLKIRHQREYDLLFKPKDIVWKEHCDGGQFEDLVKELLFNERNVVNVKKLSHTNEADGGKDLFVEIKVPLELYEKDTSNVYQIKNVLVQCKALKGNVGKSDVLDILDTLEHNNCNGYLLVVSKYVKRSLSDYLLQLKLKRKYWIDWWTKDEIEERLQKHPFLLLKYDKLFVGRST